MPVNNSILSRTRILVWLLLLIIVPVPQLLAQKYFFDNYGVKQGLSDQKVYTLFQDSKDYLWIGTASGVSRFDGKKFENFSSMNGLAANGVKCIVEDSLGYIWFGHLNGGISRYYDGKFEKAAFDSLILSGDITSIAQLNKKIWIASSKDGALRIDFPITDIKHITGKHFLGGKDGLSPQVFGAIVNRNKEYICVTDVGTRKFIDADNKFENYRMPHMTTYFSPTCLFDDSKGNIWFGTYNGGLYRFNAAENKMDFKDLIKSGMKSNWISCFAEDRKGRIWVGTWGGGIGYYNGDSLTIFNETNGLKANKIYDIQEDVEGNIIIADETNGLTIYKGDAFVTVNEKESLPDPNVYAIYQDKNGVLWFGTNAGISRYFMWSGNEPVIYNQARNSIFEEIRFIREDKDANLWIGSNQGGVIKFNMRTSRFESQPYINSRLPRDGQVKALEIDNQNHLWIGTNEGYAVGTINENNFERYISIDSINASIVTALYCDPKGMMWMGTEPVTGKSGLIRCNPVTGKAKSIPTPPGIIPKNMVMDRNGVLWVGTGEGLLGFRNDSLIATVDQNTGLLSNKINLLTVGDDGSIFIGTNNGLNRYFPATRRIYSYTERNGFSGIEAKPNAVFKTINGDLWFGTANGAMRLDLSKLESKGLEPLTHIKGMQVNYAPRTMIAGMKLNYKEKSILFDYYSICMTNPDVVRYKVMLEGADKDWRPVTTETRVIYSALPPGKYTFKVIATNSEGIWNTNPVSFHFTIKPPFYLTWWFIMISLIIIVFCIIIYIRVREQNLIKEKIILEEKVKERTAEVVQKSMIIEEKNRDITASIRYAERIQRAMLPKENMFEETFVLFLPKDIVSGDFYWMYDNGDTSFIAAVDCTGHGVPGAFMSIIGHNSLNKVVREYGLTRPSAILDQLNIEVIKSIIQSHEKGINDGMDLSLIAINRKNMIVEFAGAYNPLYQVRNGEVIVHKADRFPIGMATMDQRKTFTNFSIEVKPGDMLYLTSDGYADQFGSPEVKKFKSVNVKRLLSEIWNLPVQVQKEKLEKEIMDWKGELPQVDDIMFIGTKIIG
jgi:ligand-binding sensor domain-containing protein/serine phosphatase RsbU (regulator of sigma subunit)